MRKLFNQLLTFAVLGSVVLLTSCGDDDTDVIAPALSVEIGGTDIDQTTFNPGETVDLTVSFVSEAELAGLSYTVTVDGTAGSTVTIPFGDIGLGTAETAGTFNFTFPVDGSLSGSSVTLTVTAEDKGGQTATDSFSFDVTSEPSVSIFNTFLLAAPLGDGTSETFFSTTTGEKYSDSEVKNTTADISSEIDFGYYYGATNNATLAGIDAYPTTIVNVDAWNNQNVTLFRTTTMTEAEFDAIGEFNSDEIAAEYEVGTTEVGQKTQLTAGTVLAFKTDATKSGGSKFGLVKVVSVSGTDNQGDGINLEVKVNK